MPTIVGYSINATIVIFDRIREEMRGKTKSSDVAAVVKQEYHTDADKKYLSISTTFIMVAVLYVMGVSSIKEFALPLMVGVVCGAYSSVCITGALWYVMKRFKK